MYICFATVQAKSGGFSTASTSAHGRGCVETHATGHACSGSSDRDHLVAAFSLANRSSGFTSSVAALDAHFAVPQRAQMAA